MSQIVRCPECNRQLRVPDNFLGKRVRCPGCKTTFAAAEAPDLKPVDESPPAPRPRPPSSSGGQYEAPSSEPRRSTAPPPEEQFEESPPSTRRRQQTPSVEEDYEEETDDEDRRQRERAKGSVEDWQRVRTGVTLIVTSWCILIVTGVLAFCGGFILVMATARSAAAVAGQGRDVRGDAVGAVGGLLVLIIVVVTIALICQILKLLGYIFNLAAPAAHKAKPLAIATLGTGVGSMLLLILGNVMVFAAGVANARNPLFPTGTGAFGIGNVIALIGQIGSLVELALFLFFLRAVCFGVRADWLARMVIYLLILGGVGLGTHVLVIILFLSLSVGAAATRDAMLASGVGIVGSICACVDGVIMLCWLGWYVVTLFQVRGAIVNYIGRRARSLRREY